MATVAERLVDSLSLAGIRQVYGVVGDSLNPVTDALRRKPLKWIDVRHEETAAWPALAARVGVEFPTGLDSKGTDLHLAGLVTRTFGTLRLHANFAYTRLGYTTGN